MSIKEKIFDSGWVILQHILPSKPYLSLRYFAVFKRFPRWEEPQLFTEKLQWLKLYGFKKEYVQLVDKILVKDYVKMRIGEDYIIPTLKTWDKPEEIDFEELPDKFVLKCNHDSGNVIICKDKKTLNAEEVRKKLAKQLKTNYYLNGREKPYKFVHRRILAEEYLQDVDSGEARDYKFFCFNGEPRLLFVASERQTDVKFDFFDMDFNRLSLKNGHENSQKVIEKPMRFSEMVEIAKTLSAGMPHVRIDLYEINGKVYFGEITLYHFNGLMKFDPESWDEKLGSWLTLPQK